MPYSRGLPEQAPLVSQHPAESLRPVSTDELAYTARTPGEDDQIDTWPPCYVQVSQSVFPGLLSSGSIVFIRVAMTTSMGLFIATKLLWDSLYGELPVFLDFFMLGELAWIMLTARAWLMMHWSLNVLEWSEYDLYFGLEKHTVEMLFSVLYETTHAVGYFTSIFYALFIPSLKDPQLVDYFQAAVYVLLGPLNLFETMFLNTITFSKHKRGWTIISTAAVVVFYLHAWVPLGRYLMGEGFKRGIIDGRFLGSDESIVFYPVGFVVACAMWWVGIVELPVLVLKLEIMRRSKMIGEAERDYEARG